MAETRVCRICGSNLHIDCFPKSKNRLGKKYHRRVCKFCCRKKGESNKYTERSKQENIIEFRENERKRSKEWRDRHKKEHYAHTLLNRAIERGEIIKPDRCSKCGSVASKINGHHEDYDKPLDVIWLCDQCHAERHIKIRKQQAAGGKE